jgi:hypothetical protein
MTTIERGPRGAYRPRQNGAKAIERDAIFEFSNEAKLRAHIANSLRKMGWLVVDTSQDKQVRGGLADFPDLVCNKHGRTLYVEAKHGRNQPSEGQLEFRAKLEPHLSPTLMHCFAWSWDDVSRTLGLTI